MKVSVSKLVDVILEQLDASRDKPPSEKAMRTLLIRQGYNRRDIDSAFKVIKTQLSGEPAFYDAAPAVRQLAFYENAKIQREVHHAMTRLELMGLINPMEREMLLERFLHTDGEADMESLDFALSYILGCTRNAETQQTLLNVFEGYGPTVH